MFDAVHHLPCLHDDLTTGGSCSSLVTSGLLGVGGSTKWLAGNFPDSELHSAFPAATFHGARRGRAIPSSFDTESEEERREPTWPLMLVSYYKMKIKEMQGLAMKYSLKKIEAERDAFRAHEAEEYANQEAAKARADAAAADNGPDDTIEALQEKILMQGPKEDAVKDEVVSSTNLLDADDRRDQAMMKQIDAMQKDLVFEQKLRAAMAEQKMRSERRNLVPGVIAVDCSGRQIVTKESCDAEKNTIFRDGDCIVAGGENPPESPLELAASDQATKDEEEIEKMELDVEKATKATWAPDAEYKKANVALKAAQQELVKEKAKLAQDSKGAPVLFGKTKPAQKKHMDADAAAIKEKEKAVAAMQTKFDAAEVKKKAAAADLASKQTSDRSLREKHIKDLENLGKEEDKVEQEEVAEMGKADNEVGAAKTMMDKAQRDLSNEETNEARILREEADGIKQKAEKAHGVEQVDLQREEQQTRKWQHEAQWEANASLNKDQKKVASENTAQKVTYREEQLAAKDAVRDAYSNGEGDDAETEAEPASDDPAYGTKKLSLDLRKLDFMKRKKLATEQAEDTAKIKKTLKEEGDAELNQLTGTNEKAYAELDRNSTAMREAETQHKLKEENDHLKQNAKPSSSLSVDVRGWPFQELGIPLGSSLSKPAKLVGDPRLLRSELCLPLEMNGAVMFLVGPRRKQTVKHFL